MWKRELYAEMRKGVGVGSWEADQFCGVNKNLSNFMDGKA